MTSHIERLVQQLDGESGASYDARAELIHMRSGAVPTVIAGLPSLGGFGQLTAIEVFEEVADPRCGPALIGLLVSENPTVRQWAATALAGLEIEGAVEPLRRAYRACLERRTPPDECEPVALRWALTDLGARTPVVPSLTAGLRAGTGADSPGWPTAHFARIVDDLADHDQLILHSQFWRVRAGTAYGLSATTPDWEHDWTKPWEHLVEEARTWSLLEAAEAPVGDDVFVTPTWIDRTDLHPER
ncbi:HEAT repeat domain-containing protein [Streptomyces sp. TBY4]|uniref:HEAT repeat domain-containing protein n=1 Tax=Streptomyces sp. TBY4 TaxID=2962030 RepID=UPI0020B63D1B|nr:HEAT repeat domain-containing protein [Streptomyces sp. TBY4]MCP3759199.1 HEAT repeat domain-containing protein [Streptomyces sp. TBY4]